MATIELSGDEAWALRTALDEYLNGFGMSDNDPDKRTLDRILTTIKNAQ